MPKLWDSLSWYVLVEFGEKELAQLMLDGMVQLKCRSCGGLREGTKKVQRPGKWDDVEKWLLFLDAPLVVKGCPEHKLEFHATREFREQSLGGRTLGRPDNVSKKQAARWQTIGANDLPNNKNFKPTVVDNRIFQDLVYDQLIAPKLH